MTVTLPPLAQQTRNHYTVAQLRVHYNGVIGRERLYRLIKAGHLKASLINGKLIVPAFEVKRFDELLYSDKPLHLKDTDGTTLIERGIA